MTITASAETDLAVAAACGFQVIYYELGGPWWIITELRTDAERRPFRPSTDLNDAVMAAEKCPSWNRYRIIKRRSGAYEFEAHCIGDDGWSRFSEYPTIPLAICAGILLVNLHPLAEKP